MPAVLVGLRQRVQRKNDQQLQLNDGVKLGYAGDEDVSAMDADPVEVQSGKEAKIVLEAALEGI